MSARLRALRSWADDRKFDLTLAHGQHMQTMPTRRLGIPTPMRLPSVIVPERAVDAQSLIALSDLVVSAGGTMNREAAALGVPVYTTYGGRLGGVDEELIREGRLRPLTDPRALDLHKRTAAESTRTRRNPAELLQLLLSALPED